MSEDLYSKIIGNPVARTLLTPASFVYGAVGYARLKAYANGCIERAKPDVPVISVGNLSVGGTGKTPITIELAERFIHQGNRVAILSRGYKRKASTPYTVVSNGEKILATCQEAGDEPYMMAQAVPAAVVISGKSRSETAEIAIKKYHCDIIILDDGFQHLKLRRDIDVVLLDYNETLDDNMVPAGRLREPMSALGRATHIIISKVPLYPDPARTRRFQSLIAKYAPEATVSMCRFRPAYLRAETPLSPSEVSGQKVVALCGIAKPASFVDSIKQLGAEVVSMSAFPDHHWFSEADLQKLESKVTTYKANYIVTTEKDFVRLELPDSLKSKVMALVMETEWIGEPPSFNLPAANTTVAVTQNV
ncbi:MAG: tetraacyldisaccharide 4'-kinase [Candidatus Obscuribacterales bacterium]|nr:tetraacyldisaccharide 4'-kinase [Candidatus Obscuribacterales bacterium]